jgi:hypothetical protein
MASIATMIADVRRDIREQSPVTISDTAITAVIQDAAEILWESLVKADDSIGRERVSLTSVTNSFAIPSDVFRITDVWDMRTTAKTITDATNANPIVFTSAAHGFSDDDIVRVHDVGGNTNGNVTGLVDNKTTNTFELSGVAGNAAYTSGGKVFLENTQFRRLRPITPRESTGKHRYEYFLRGGFIVVDWLSFSDDLIIDYIRIAGSNPTGDGDKYDDIPARYHVGLVSYAVMQLIRPLPGQDLNAGDIQGILEFHTNRFNSIMDNIATLADQDGSPIEFVDDVFWDSL